MGPQFDHKSAQFAPTCAHIYAFADFQGAQEEDVEPFCFEKQCLIIDFKSLCASGIPFDPESNGVRALRAIVFKRGMGTFYPDDHSKLVIAGEYFVVSSLTLVHFDTATQREPELLLNFVDFGLLNSAVSGVSVETLALPLYAW